MPEPSLERVATAVGTLADETRLLMREVRNENDGRKRQNRLLLALVVLTLIGIVGVAMLLVRQQNDSAARSEAATQQRLAQLELSEQINDCLDPEGTCFRRSQERQAGVIAQLVQGVVVVNRCAVSAGDDVAAYDACIKAAGLPPVKPAP